jgi:hypothetical protein
MMAGMRSASTRIAEALLVLLAFALPYEAPLFALGPLQITTVELVLYAMLAAWGAGVAIEVLRDRPWRDGRVEWMRDGLCRAAALWAVVLFASAIVAPSHRAAAIKFALRSLSGILALFATRSLARRPGVDSRVLTALLAGGLLSAVTGVLDGFVPDSAPAWRLFHQGTFDALGLRRASGVFEYPTIAAMYWEALVPLFIVAPFVTKEAPPPALRRASIAACAVLLLAIFASATRTSLAGVAVTCGLLAVLGRRTGSQVTRAAAATLAILAGLLVVALRPGGADAPLGQRLRWWHDDGWFGAVYDVPAAVLTANGGDEIAVPITVHNTGSIAWRRAGERPTHLSYHWTLEPEDGSPARLVEFEGRRTDLRADVEPGNAVQLLAFARAPIAAGRYRLSWDLVQENVTWFSERGIAPGTQVVEVRTGPPTAALPTVHAPSAAPAPPSRPSLWRVAIALWLERPLLGVGPDNFRRRYQAVLAPPPGGAPYTDTRMHANSLYFETLADLGLAGVAGLAAIAVAIVRALRRHWESGCLAGIGYAVAALAFFVHGLLDYFFEFTPLYGLFWVSLGLTAALAPARSASSGPSDTTR